MHDTSLLHVTGGPPSRVLLTHEDERAGDLSDDCHKSFGAGLFLEDSHGLHPLAFLSSYRDLKVPKCEILMSWILIIFLA